MSEIIATCGEQSAHRQSVNRSPTRPARTHTSYFAAKGDTEPEIDDDDVVLEAQVNVVDDLHPIAPLKTAPTGDALSAPSTSLTSGVVS